MAICAVAVAFIASSVSSAIAYRSELHPLNSRSYLATASAALADVPPDAVIYPTQVPAQVASSLFGQLSQVQNALAPLADQVPGQPFRWTSSPSGLVKHLMIFDAQGRLHPAAVQGPRSFPFRHKADCVLTACGMVLPLTADVYALPLLMQIGYYAAHPVTLAVAFGGHQSQVHAPRQPARLRLPAGARSRERGRHHTGHARPGGLHRHRDDRECTGLSDRHTGPGVPATRPNWPRSSSRRVQNG